MWQKDPKTVIKHLGHLGRRELVLRLTVVVIGPKPRLVMKGATARLPGGVVVRVIPICPLIGPSARARPVALRSKADADKQARVAKALG